MADHSSERTERELPSRSRRLDGVAWGLIALGLLGAGVNATTAGPTWLQLGALLGHGFALATGAAMLARHRGAVFAISEAPVNFHEFAALFRDVLKCPYALFFDGVICSLHSTQLKRSDKKTDLGPII